MKLKKTEAGPKPRPPVPKLPKPPKPISPDKVLKPDKGNPFGHPPELQDEVADLTMSELIATQEEVLVYLTACMRGEIQEEVLMTRTKEGQFAGQIIKRLKKQAAPKDRNKAAELLAKRYGLLNDRILLEGVKQVVFTGEDEIKD